MHCLNLKITYNCTNNCSFCFSSYLKDTNISETGMIKAIEYGRKNGCNELVISGGEPTTKPELIIKLITLAETLGYDKYIIQTNGSGLEKNLDLVNFLNEISQKKELCISFSVHGHISNIHDEMSGNVGAFNSLMNAMNNISNTNCNIYTNTVISSINIKHLKDISTMLLQYNPTIMQFSMMHLSEPSSLSVPLAEAVRAIRNLKGIVSLNVLKTEGIPYCLMYTMEKCVGESCWPGILDIYNKNNHYLNDFKQLDYDMRKKLRICSECIMNNICMGVWKEHFHEFTELGIKPIK